MKARWILCLALLTSVSQLSGQEAYQPLVDAGKSQLQAGNSDQALTAATKAIGISPERWDAYALAGGALMNLKRYEDAEDKFSKAIDLAPDIKKPTLRSLRKQCVLADAGIAQSLATPDHRAGPAQEEVVLWKSIEKQNDAEALRAYLAQYPNGAFAPLAYSQLDHLDQEAKKAAQADAETTNDPDVLRAYLSKYPRGAYASDAKVKLGELQRGATLHVYRFKASQRNSPLTPDLFIDRKFISPLAFCQSFVMIVPPGKHVLSISFNGKDDGKPFEDLYVEPGGEYWVWLDIPTYSTHPKWTIIPSDLGKKQVSTLTELKVVKQ